MRPPIAISAGRELDRFNWALDYFDPMARGNAQPALWMVDEGAGETKLSFARIERALEPRRQFPARARRAPRRPHAADARQCGAAVGDHAGGDEARRGDHPGDDAARPATICRPLRARPRAPCDRRRRRRRQVRRSAGRLHPHRRRRATCRAGSPIEDGYEAPARSRPTAQTRADDPLLLYFTSGTTAKPKLVLHTHQSYPVGHLSTMYWIGLQPGDVHLNISSPGWAKHAWSCFFAPWNAGATVFIFNQRALQRARTARRARALRRHHASARRRRSGAC